MRFFYSNSFDSATLTASTANADYPAANIQNIQRTKVWKTTGAQAAETLVIAFSAPVECSSIIISDHDLTASDTDIKIQAHTSDSWGSPAFEKTLTWNSAPIYDFFNPSQSYRYWRLIFTKSASSEIRQIGRIFLGKYYETEKGIDLNGLQFTPRDLSTSLKSIGGYTYTYQRSRFDSPNVTFSNITMAMMDNLKTVWDTVGTHTPLFFQLDTDQGFNKMYYGRLVDLPAKDFVTPAGETMIFKTQVKLEELL